MIIKGRLVEERDQEMGGKEGGRSVGFQVSQYTEGKVLQIEQTMTKLALFEWLIDTLQFLSLRSGDIILL